MDGDWGEDSEPQRRAGIQPAGAAAARLNAPPALDGRGRRINPATMLGLVAMMPAWQWCSIVTASLYLVPAADAMMRQNREPRVRDPLD
jgi:hypothetical protein